MTYVIGLTGGIASGKSTVARIFESFHIPIIDADEIAREIVAPPSSLLAKIKAHFGDTVMREDGTLNRPALRTRIFQHPDEKTWLENLLHPEIDQIIKKRIRAMSAHYCILVIPLLIEHIERYKPLVHTIVTVEVSKKTQLKRLLQREKQQIDLLKKMIQAQTSRKARSEHAHYLLTNEDDIATLQKKVYALHQSFMQLKK